MAERQRLPFLLATGFWSSRWYPKAQPVLRQLLPTTSLGNLIGLHPATLENLSMDIVFLYHLALASERWSKWETRLIGFYFKELYTQTSPFLVLCMPMWFLWGDQEWDQKQFSILLLKPLKLILYLFKRNQHLNSRKTVMANDWHPSSRSVKLSSNIGKSRKLALGFRTYLDVNTCCLSFMCRQSNG